MSVRISDILHKALPFFIVRLLLKICFRVEVRGLENFKKAGARVLVIANHVSKIDAVVLSAFLPGRILFATQAELAHRWWLKPYWRVGEEFSLDQADPMTAKKMVDALKRGQPCMIFPEGRVTRNGALMKVYESPGIIADNAEAEVLPVRIDGLQYSLFSDLKGVVRRRLFPKVTLTLLPAARLKLPEDVKGHERRRIAGTAIYDQLERALVEGVPYTSMLRHLLETRPIRGGCGVILEDVRRMPLTHDAFVAKFFTLARAIAHMTGKEKITGIMMPNGIPNGTTIFALQALDRITAMVNFTAGPLRIVQACHMAEIKTVISLRAFVDAMGLAPLVSAMEKENIKVIYLEDLMASVKGFDRFVGFAKAHLPACIAACCLTKDAKRPALMLFTSGTEGMPKGVMLSHLNIVSNTIQTAVRLGFVPSDSAFASLPMFHSFGLTLGFFMPLFIGTRAFLFPSPLRYHDIPELVYDTKSTLLLGTDTFLANYEKNAAPHDFYYLRFAIGGAEKIKPETRRVWAEKFGVRLFEGYGTTEASPVIGVNSPMYYKAGSIGRGLAGLDIRLQPVEGIKNGAELIVRGLNIMLGYVKADKPGVIQPPEDGWYNTGDVVQVDENGFITIVGRTKRFAKVAGEMVSLGAIEAIVCATWPGVRHVAVSVPHERKGEMIVLLTECDEVDTGVLLEKFRSVGLTELSVPRKLVRVEQIPLLGSGKTDYVRAKQVAEESLNTEQEKE